VESEESRMKASVTAPGTVTRGRLHTYLSTRRIGTRCIRLEWSPSKPIPNLGALALVMNRDTDATGQLGVNLVERHVLRDLKWVFRVQYVSDQGVDAQVETKIDGTTTGRLLALQIKAGKSWFSEPSETGWIFRFDDRKANLWFGHALPVVVVLVDLEHEIAYWQRIEAATTESTGKNFKVIIPASNRLETAGEEWEHLASGIEDRAVERYEFARQSLAPDTRLKLDELAKTSQRKAAVLALHLVEGRSNAVDTSRAILTASPHWISHPEGLGWRALASFARNYDAREEAANALEKAAADDYSNRGRALAEAALCLLPVDTTRSANLLDLAERENGPWPWIAVGRVLLAHPEGDAHPFQTAHEKAFQTYVEPEGEAIVGTFLAEQASRRGDFDQAVVHMREAITRAKETTGLKTRCAQWLLMGASSAGNQERNYAAAKDLLIDAVVGRRSWGGDSVEPLKMLLGVLALQGEFFAMLQWSTQGPNGLALAAEASNPVVMRHAARAANLVGDYRLAHSIASGLDDDPESRLIKAQVGLITIESGEMVNTLTQVMELARDSNDYEEFVKCALRLAHLGVDASEGLIPLVQAGIIQAPYMELIRAVALASTDAEDGVRQLRVLARSNPVAGEVLIDTLSTMNRWTEAAEAARVMYVRHRLPFFLLMQADSLLNDDEQMDAAEAVVREALAAVPSGYPVSKGRFHTYLAGRSADRGDWPGAEAHIQAAIGAIPTPTHSTYWRLVVTQLAQGEDKRAASTIREYGLWPRNPEEARQWLSSQAALEWNTQVASEALTLALRFGEEDPKLSAALLMQIISGTTTDADRKATASSESGDVGPESQADQLDPSVRVDWRPVVPEGLHREAFSALTSLLDEHGEASGVRVMRGTNEELVDELAELLKARAGEPIRELLRMAREGHVPAGAVVTTLGRCYATALVERSTGLQLAAAPDDETNDSDVSDALSGLDSAIVVETSTLMLLSQCQRGEDLTGRFASLALPTSSRLDILRAGLETRGVLASGGRSMAWDPDQEGIVISETTPEQYLVLRARTEALEQASARCLIEAPNGPPLLPMEHAEGVGPWLDPIELAAASGKALWSDDLALRALARSVGVRTFGTPSLIEAVTQLMIESGSVEEVSRAVSEREYWVREFVSQFVVDVPTTLTDLCFQAEKDHWAPKAAAAVLTRASWWAWEVNPIGTLRELLSGVAKSHVELVETWMAAAMEGVIKAYRAEVASAMLAVVALLPATLDLDSTLVLRGFEAARLLATREEVADPVTQSPVAARALAELEYLSNPEDLLSQVLTSLASDTEAQNVNCV
jgi:hypothetical protein